MGRQAGRCTSCRAPCAELPQTAWPWAGAAGPAGPACLGSLAGQRHGRSSGFSGLCDLAMAFPLHGHAGLALARASGAPGGSRARRTSSTCQTAGGLAMALGASGARLPGWPLAAIGTSPALSMGLALALRQCCVAWPACRAGPTAACVGLVCWQEMPRGGQVCRQRGRQATRLPGRWEGGGQGPLGLAGPSRVRPMHPGPCPPPLPHPLPLPAGRLQGPQSHGLVHRWPLSLASGVGSGAGGR